MFNVSTVKKQKKKNTSYGGGCSSFRLVGLS